MGDKCDARATRERAESSMDVDAFRQLCQQSPPSGSHVLPWSPALVHDSSVAASIRNRTRDERVRGSSENRMGLPGKGNRSRRLLPGLSCPVLSFACPLTETLSSSSLPPPPLSSVAAGRMGQTCWKKTRLQEQDEKRAG